MQGLKLLRDLGFRLFVLARDWRHDTGVWRQPAEVNLLVDVFERGLLPVR